MSISPQVHIGDVGTVFEATITDQDGAVVNIGAASVRQMKFKKPDGTVLTKTPTLVTNGSDGKMQYVSVAGDLDQAGKWQIEGYVEIGAGKWSTDIQPVTVAAILS